MEGMEWEASMGTRAPFVEEVPGQLDGEGAQEWAPSVPRVWSQQGEQPSGWRSQWCKEAGQQAMASLGLA